MRRSKVSVYILGRLRLFTVLVAASHIVLQTQASLIIGDSAIEIKELQEEQNRRIPPKAEELQQHQGQQGQSQDEGIAPGPSLILGTLSDTDSGQPFDDITKQFSQSGSPLPTDVFREDNRASLNRHQMSIKKPNVIQMQPPPPLVSSTSGDSSLSVSDNSAADPKSVEEKKISGRVVDFELDHAGGHNKAKIKKKKKKKKEEEVSIEQVWFLRFSISTFDTNDEISIFRKLKWKKKSKYQFGMLIN